MLMVRKVMCKSRYLLIFLLFDILFINVNNCHDDKILSRKKRYLMFPEGSNFVMTMSFVKALMRRAPRGVNVLGECDVPFKLPSDTRLYKKYNMHYRHRRDIYSQMEMAFNSLNLNGISCIKRILCEVEQFAKLSEPSMVKDMLTAIFTFPELANATNHKYNNYCEESTFTNCNLPILKILLDDLNE